MKRLLVYLTMVVVFIVAIILKIGIIKEKEAATVVSILGEWQRDGVPVETHEVSRRDLIRTEKLTGEVKSAHRLEAAVSASLARSLQSGDTATVPSESGAVMGSVLQVARSSGLTGLYRVEIGLKDPVELPRGASVAVDVEVDRVPNVLAVPGSAVRTDEGKTYVWKLIDGAAVRTEVQVGESSQGFLRVRSGLSEGDLVVARGQSNIESELGVQVIGNL